MSLEILAKLNIGPDRKNCEVKTIAGFEYNNGITVTKEGFCGYISAFPNIHASHYCNTENVYIPTEHGYDVIGQYIRDKDLYRIFSSGDVLETSSKPKRK